MTLSEYSVASLLLLTEARNQSLGQATGFIVVDKSITYLITNWHVLAGRNPSTGQPLHSSCALPDSLKVHYLKPQTTTDLEWVPVSEALLDQSGNPLWLEHPKYGRKVDVVALPLKHHKGFQIFPLELQPPAPIALSVADYLSIIGFPFGMSANGLFGIWLKGSIASEPPVNYNDLPCFLIDARTRSGQSGSPVISYYPAGQAIPREDGVPQFMAGPVGELQGVYSGRINEESDIGIVWKKKVISEIINGQKLGNHSITGA